eukprot:5061400-Amphidinium_carterae.1
MDTQRDARLLALQDISGEMETPEPLEARPRPPALPMEAVGSSLSSSRSTQAQAPGVPAARLPPDSDTGGFTSAPVPEVGEEICDLGPELGSALVRRRTAERRSIFAQRGVLGPDDCPYQQDDFDATKDYRGVAWGYPVPQEEWERRICATRVKALSQSVMHVEPEGAERCHLQSASSATTGPASDIWRFRPVWPDPTLCVRHTQGWSTAHVETTRTFASTGRVVLAVYGFGLDGRPPAASSVRSLELGYRFYYWKQISLAPQIAWERKVGWLPPTCRIGEAAKPGPTICSVNPGGWSLVEPVLNLKHDVVAVQETFVLRDKVNSAKFVADKLGSYSSFTPARKTEGRPS